LIIVGVTTILDKPAGSPLASEVITFPRKRHHDP
jgi:hypothetical protein